MPIELREVWKEFDTKVKALDIVNLDIAGGEFVSIVGPSGCGKSTLLRIVAGLLAPSGGACVRATNARAAFVFQDAALLPWRSVLRNAELLMELEGYAAPDRRQRAEKAMQLVGLSGFADAYPHQLSGGMRMRLSLARAMALQPDLLLLDEPLAAVDELTRDTLQEELQQLWRKLNFTALLVTHNVHEAVYLSTRIAVMSPRPGRIEKVINVPFAFPRAPELRATAEFAALTGQVSALLRHHAVGGAE
ncbi:ABC transporter ATP-binding protein [Roseiarcaceae bacterium H3SJ34-1]|uniref:ABC transporter ATP-binding protein n=1 Tax=Terripilifer ovatus TaxID=3032367 RepID=UPI003AB9B6D1|nr:ABC transporter ATP-binding protein [Roseiarcaceae bacterium H3SJ34-1]